MSKRRMGLHAGIIGLFVVLFFLNTAGHDYTCHEELDGICNPLHFSSSALDVDAGNIVYLLPSTFLLSWNNDEISLPDFIKNIFHPPD